MKYHLSLLCCSDPVEIVCSQRGGVCGLQCIIKSVGKMVTRRSLLLLCLAAITFDIVCATVQDTINNVEVPKSIELLEGVSVKFPETNNTAKLMSFEVDTNGTYEGRKKKEKMIEKFLPLFIMPFLIQSAIVPMFLGMLKFMLFKSLMVGKLALALILLNAFKNHNSFKGRDAEMADINLLTSLSIVEKVCASNIVILLCGVSVCLVSAGAQSQNDTNIIRAAPDPFMDTMKLSQENYYRLPKHIVPKNYKLKLWPDMSKKTFSGSVAIQLQLLEPTQTIQLHSNKL
ncbi:Uncharacterized protein OBRU01_22677, partial [Operophtera brumata]